MFVVLKMNQNAISKEFVELLLLIYYWWKKKVLEKSNGNIIDQITSKIENISKDKNMKAS